MTSCVGLRQNPIFGGSTSAAAPGRSAPSSLTSAHLRKSSVSTPPKPTSAAEKAAAALSAESTRPEALSRLFRDAGLKEVITRVVEIDVAFKDFDDYWTSNTGFAGPVARYVTGLSPDDRERFMQEVKARLPSRADGSIHFKACAPAVRGTVP